MRIFLMFFLLFPLCQNALAIDCPPGYEEDPQYGNCINCEFGYYSPGGSWGCEACPAGTRANGNTSPDDCESCPVGTYSNEGSTTCISCPKGKYADTPRSDHCTECPPGTFADTTGNKECKKCPANTFSSTQGAKSCDVCPSGTYSDEGATECTTVNNPASIYQCVAGTQPKNGTDTPTSASDCEDCPAGTYKSLTGNTSCTPCESGKYVSGTGNTECQPCPPDTYFSGTGATGRNKCQSCPNGKHSPSGSTSINSCVSDPTPPVNTCNCPDNQACKSATDTTCIPCGETPQSGITAQGICKMCNLGYIFDGTKCTQARIISPEQMKKCMGKIEPDEFKRCALGDY